jgi:predicted transcriptional regulator
MSTLSIELPPEERALLHKLATSAQRTDEEIASVALRGYLRFEAEQIERIRSGIDAADKGNFASHENSR